MQNNAENTLIVITGATASGKTHLAIDVALKLNTEIVSFDSRQFYREMSIGTAKPSAEQLHEVKHHFIGNISIQREYSAGQYERDAIELLAELFKKNKQVVLTGGSGMYLDAVLFGFDELPKVEEATREKLNEIYKEEGLTALQTMLAKLDTEYYHQVDINNSHRLIRALELILTSGTPYSQLRKAKSKERNFKTILVGLDIERELLYNQINLRVDRMMEKGLLEEVKSLYPFRQTNALQTVGYKELFDFIEGKQNVETAVNLIKQNTRHFAKRQMTWLRKYEHMQWLKPDKAKEKIMNLKF